jgi:hypothetical protein
VSNFIKATSGRAELARSLQMGFSSWEICADQWWLCYGLDIIQVSRGVWPLARNSRIHSSNVASMT